MIMIMIMNLYSAKSIEEYSKALYIKLKKIEIKKLKLIKIKKKTIKEQGWLRMEKINTDYKRQT